MSLLPRTTLHSDSEHFLRQGLERLILLLQNNNISCLLLLAYKSNTLAQSVEMSFHIAARIKVISETKTYVLFS